MEDSVARVVHEWAEVRPDLDVSPITVIARMARIRSIVEAEQARIFSGAGITGADFPVLVTLRRRNPPHRLTHGQLSAELGLTPGTVTTRVDHLDRLGFVRRQVDDHDARVRWVELTDAGMTVVEELIPVHLDLEARLLSGIDEQRRERLAEDLGVLLASLENRGG